MTEGAAGGHRPSSDEYFEGWQVTSAPIECTVADVRGMIRSTGEATDNHTYDVRVRINGTGPRRLAILAKDNFGDAYEGFSTLLYRYAPVEITAYAADHCVNQGASRTW
ncbi:MAG: hypothetical protein PSX37_00635 [bacterium]|nr:hypothetical protein [bacterium]